MYRDTAQCVRVCRALLRSVRREGLWTDEGPSERACELLEQNGGPLSSGERVMLLLAFEAADHPTPLRVADLLRLDGKLGSMADELRAALKQDANAIDAWLARYDVRAPRAPTRPSA